MDNRQVQWTIRLTTAKPIDETRILEALANLGDAEVVTYKVVRVKA